jgi:hypothetical protein
LLVLGSFIEESFSGCSNLRIPAVTPTLDHTQRLNLHALLGAQRADVGSIRAIWAIQDRIALDSDEEKAVELNREMVAGQERVAWNPARSIPAKDFEFTDADVARLKAALETWDSYGANADRHWLKPLVETQLSVAAIF